MSGEFRDWTYEENSGSNVIYSLPRTCFPVPEDPSSYTVQATYLIPKQYIITEPRVTDYLEQCCKGQLTVEKNCGYSCTYKERSPWGAKNDWQDCVQTALGAKDFGGRVPSVSDFLSSDVSAASNSPVGLYTTTFVALVSILAAIPRLHIRF